ncbi:hypothetical protein, partial [Klebsiella pneumoniae]|uniref:hypothetical protein n=1 Tax=Klebsiella pneumoniae TaxID=573 RepID=UPI001953A037
TIRSVPPYRRGGTRSQSGAIWAIFIGMTSWREQSFDSQGAGRGPAMPFRGLIGHPQKAAGLWLSPADWAVFDHRERLGLR